MGRGDGLRVLQAPPKGQRLLSWVASHQGFPFGSFMEAVLYHLLFAHIIAEVCDALALVTIALGLSKRIAPVVPGALQHR